MTHPLTSGRTSRASPLRKGVRWLVRWLYSLVRPQIGVLRQYGPRPVEVPGAYATVRASPSAPRVSIVVPSYNQGRFLRATLDSVLDQQIPDLELIVQDGGSTDNTPTILQEYAPRLKHWESRRDNGQAHAINLGFRHATGEILAYLNSDDILLPGALAYVGDYFERHPKVDVVYGHRVVIDEAGMEVGRWILPAHHDEVLRWADFVPQETLFWRRRIWVDTGAAMDEDFRYALDWDLLVRFLDHRATFVRLPRFLGAFRVHASQKTTADFDQTSMSECRKLAQRMHGRPVETVELQRRIRPYVLKSGVLNRLFRLGLLSY
jgi:glycosyltransferase involved in cell wall biosynthesis